MLKFLFGRPGSGKTSYIIEEIKKAAALGEKTYLLVPEQQAYTSEAMLADLPPSSALCLEVVSFSRLCEIVFGVVGGLTDSHIGSAERHLIMWQSLREVSSYLTQYKHVKADSSFGAMMLSAIDELHANSITPEECESLSEKCKDSALSAKLADISLVYSNFQRNLEARLGESALASENKLSRLSSALSKNDIFANCNFFIDSFTSFTGEEFAVLEEIIAQSRQTTISFCSTSRRANGAHTDSIYDTIKRFTKIADKRGIEREDLVLRGTKKGSVEISELEKNLWNFSVTKDNLPQINEEDRGNIETYVCSNEYEEAQLAALNILKAHKNGVKYSEIAIIMRDAESRRGILNTVLDRMNIPYFYSEKTDLSTTPAARLILSALRCVTYNYQTSDVITLLKTGLCGIDLSDADLFEEYCSTWEISGSLFVADAWSMNPDGYTVARSPRGDKILAAANKVRASLIPPLERLKESFSIAGGDTVKGCRAVYDYLREIKLSENLSSIAELELSLGNVKEAGELLRTYDFIISALTNISTILADTKTNCEELTSAIEIMLKYTDIASVPAINDCVTVGSADTLRVENIKVGILLGLCEGEFPANFSDGGILNENDKKMLDELGIDLSSRESRVVSDELFYVYRAMTKPEDKLIISTCTSQIGGRALTPSVAYNRVRFLFPYIPEKTFDLKRIKNLSHNGDSNADFLDGGEIPIYIDPMIVRNIFGDRLYLSKSSVTSFAECPYKYWCDYVLKLREQKSSQISYASAGTIIHYVLEKFLKKIVNPDGSLPEISDDELVLKVNEIVDMHISELGFHVSPSLSYTFARLRDLALIMTKSVLDEFKTSDFKILAFEKRISDKSSDSIKPLEITIQSKDGFVSTVFFGGVIDRIDCYDNGEKRFLRVVDYKTGSHKFDASKVATGEDIQLPAYLFTAANESNQELFGNGTDIFPASALFLSADESEGKVAPVRSGFILGDDEILRATNNSPEPESKKKKKSSKGDLAVSGEEFESIESDFRSSISNIGESIYSGNIPKTPSEDACRFCTMRDSCTSAAK